MAKWREVRFGDVIKINPSVKLEKDNKYSYIEIADLTPGIFEVKAEVNAEYVGQSSSKFENDDILFSRITPCLENKKIAQCKIKGEKGFGSTEFFIFRAKKGVSQSYIKYLAQSDKVVLPAVNSMTGASGRQRADKSFIEKIKIQIPDLPTQEKIANILFIYDRLIENNTRRIKLLEQAAEELYKEWFVRMRFPGHENTKFVNGIPVDWNISKVKMQVNRLPFGILYKSNDTHPSGKVIVIDQSQDAFVGYHNNEPSHIASIDNPIAIFGDHSCKFQLMICPFSLSENVIPYMAKGNTTTIYLYYSIYRLIETTEYKRHWSELMGKKILIAPMGLQKCFGDHVSSFLLNIELLKNQNQNLIKQRDLLLPRLVSGKMEV